MEGKRGGGEGAVVVVLTCDLTHVLGGGGGGGGADVRLDARVYPCTPVDATNYGGRVPVDTTPQPCLKNLPVSS